MRMSFCLAIGTLSAVLVSSVAFAQTAKKNPEPIEFFRAVGDNGSHYGSTPDTAPGGVVTAQTPAPPPASSGHKIKEPIEFYRAVGDNGSHPDAGY